jgi:PHD/YefM family antitoxin component YafN of YafNO toxin-antitoxin module
MPSGRFVRAHELQLNSQTVLRDLNASGEPCYITEDGKAKAVLMDINRYNALMDIIEEAESGHHHHHEVGDETRKHVSVRGIISKSTAIRMRKRR